MLKFHFYLTNFLSNSHVSIFNIFCPFSTSSASVRMGSSKHDSGGDVYNVAKIIFHPNFDYFELSNDACILVLEETPTNSMSVKRYIIIRKRLFCSNYFYKYLILRLLLFQSLSCFLAILSYVHSWRCYVCSFWMGHHLRKWSIIWHTQVPCLNDEKSFWLIICMS